MIEDIGVYTEQLRKTGFITIPDNISVKDLQLELFSIGCYVVYNDEDNSLRLIGKHPHDERS